MSAEKVRVLQADRAEGQPQPGSPALIEIRDVSKTYFDRKLGPIQALDTISLSIRAGEFVSILGTSGCGKSTLLMLIAGLYTPTAGSIEIGGVPVRSPRTDIGIVFQRPVLLDWRTALQNVLIQAEARRLDKDRYSERARALLASVGLAGFEDALPHNLSGGMQQRVSICRALIHEPPLLLMDEPFAALDAFTRQQLMLDLQRIWRNSGTTIIFVTHSVSEAVFQSDRVIVMSPRPGKVDSIWDIQLPRPRRLQVETSDEFRQYVADITALFKQWGVLHEEDDSNTSIGAVEKGEDRK